MFRLSQVKTGVPLKGLYYKENLKPLPKVDPKLEKILDQRIKRGVKQIKVQTTRWRCARGATSIVQHWSAGEYRANLENLRQLNFRLNDQLNKLRQQAE